MTAPDSITSNLHLAFQFDTATAAIERVEFTAEDKVEIHRRLRLAVALSPCALPANSPLNDSPL